METGGGRHSLRSDELQICYMQTCAGLPVKDVCRFTVHLRCETGLKEVTLEVSGTYTWRRKLGRESHQQYVPERVQNCQKITN